MGIQYLCDECGDVMDRPNYTKDYSGTKYEFDLHGKPFSMTVCLRPDGKELPAVCDKCFLKILVDVGRGITA